eukprot:4599904-Pleurochrysis_carterae.AAC.1
MPGEYPCPDTRSRGCRVRAQHGPRVATARGMWACTHALTHETGRARRARAHTDGRTPVTRGRSALWTAHAHAARARARPTPALGSKSDETTAHNHDPLSGRGGVHDKARSDARQHTRTRPSRVGQPLAADVSTARRGKPDVDPHDATRPPARRVHATASCKCVFAESVAQK